MARASGRSMSDHATKFAAKTRNWRVSNLLIGCEMENIMASRFGFAAVFLFALGASALAQDLPIDQQLPPVAAPTNHIQTGQLPVLDTTPQFDAEHATAAYLARVSGAAKDRSDSYTETGYAWGVVDFLYGLLIAALLLWSQVSARVRDWAQEKT